MKVPNDLIQTTLDSANGYREAAETISRADCKAVFADRAARRDALAHRLQEEVLSFGGKPERDQSALGKVHNKFVELKSAVAGDSDKAVIDEVERGEDTIRNQYEKALRDEDLPTASRELIQQAFGEIQANHDDIIRIKRELH